MNNKLKSSKKRTIIIIVIAVFLLLGLLTMVFGEDKDTTSDTTTEKTTSEADSNTDTSAQKNTLIVNKPLETDPYEELESLIGLSSVKEEVKTLSNFVKVQKMRADKGLKTPSLSYHLVFTGSPGTGKTTVARIVARIYKDLGILKKGHTVETDRSGLVAEYIGQTAVKTNAIIDSAIHGVLFIDEAYSLVPDEGKGQDYGQEAISTLLKRMEDNRDSLVVVIAGYPDEMHRFINSNPGLQSRFNRYIFFPDYSSQELYQIFEMYLKKNQYSISNDAADYLKKSFEEAVKHKDRKFGNARFVRNVFEKSIQCQANRLSDNTNATHQQLTEITIDDVTQAMKGKH